MSRVKQLALDVDAEFTAGSPFSITFTPTNPVVFTSPTVAYKTRGGDVVTGTAVPAVSTDGDTVTLTWSPTCSAANNTTTAKKGMVYSFEVQALVGGVGPVPLFGGENTVWPLGVATSGVASSTSVTGTINVGGVAITGTVTIGAEGPPGDDGAPGSVWRSGTGAPSNGAGIVGDWYLNDANGDVYEKTGASAWTLRDNLTGPPGDDGEPGDPGADGAANGPQTINAQTGTTYTPVAGDVRNLTTLSNAAAIALTLPPDGDVTWPIGETAVFAQLGAGQVTVGPGSGVTIRTSGLTNKSRAQYSRFAAQKIAANTYSLFGDLAVN